MKKIIIIPLLFFAITLSANPGTNEWAGGWPYPLNPGLLTIIEYAVPDQTDIKPLTTNLLIQKFSIRNDIASTNNLPTLTSIRLDMIGSAIDTDFSNVHLYYDSDGAWNGNELEFRTNTTNNYILGTKFVKNYSPGQFENSIVNFGEIGSDEMGLHLPWSNTYYFYITIDVSRNVVDMGTIDTRIYGVKMFMRCSGSYWEQNMVPVDTSINARFNVVATNLKIFGEPPAPGINVDTAFPLTVKAMDKYGNVDKEYTGTVYFSCTDPNAVLPYTASAPYTFVPGDQGVKVFNGFKLYSGPKENITVSDGAGGLNDDVSDDIIVIADVDHFKMVGDGTNLPYEPTITAGQPLSILNVTNIRVTAYNYLSAIIQDYQGSVYFRSSLPGKYNSYPASTNTKYTFTGIGGDDGSHDFPASEIFLTKSGKQNLVITDGTHTGEWLNITVQPADYSKLVIECETNVTGGTFFNVVIKATDPYDNIITGISTSISLEIERLDDVTDKAVEAVYPSGDLQLSSGQVTISDLNSVQINEGGNFRIKVTDLNTPSISAYKNVIVSLTIEGSRNSAVSYNYIHPGGSQSVDIYYNNTKDTGIDVTVKIYSITGKLVKEFQPQSAVPGINRFKSWNAKNDNGDTVSSGVYIAVIKGGSTTERHHIVVVK
ncbi:MAG: hypothetical protein KKH98_08135 [Spirochaetes bacterium]|nr:hypothetical protein [Spirochaetota bacterium]